jgi:stearoyl-CoA desaturase (delta-9 desaturase)
MNRSNPGIRPLYNLIRWFDSEAPVRAESDRDPYSINWLRCLPFIFIHLGCFAVIWTGISTTAILACLFFFWLRMFAITAFYHRLFSHRSYKTNRFWQFIFAVLGNSSCQRGPLWWAAHHRKHHKESDQEADLHSPVQHGFWFSHVGWFMSEAGFKTDYSVIKDLAKYPELRFLNRFDILVPALYAGFVFALGEVIAALWPASGTNGWQMLVWSFFISTTLLFHATFTINSLGHIWGSRRFATKDHSRNNPWFALLTLGEGWHNNHHRFAVSARQGFYWWEIDISYYLLKLLSMVGIVSDLNPVPERILDEGRKQHKHLNK